MNIDPVRGSEPTVADAIPVAAFCGHCGGGTGRSESCEPISDQCGARLHRECAARLVMEPPRYCVQCGRRMKVQVVPRGWTAECSRHGRTG